MDPVYALFLQAVKAALRSRQVDWSGDVTPDQLVRMLELARMHHVLPLVFEAVYTCPAARALEPGLYAKYRSICVHSVMTQTLKTEEFLELYAQWRRDGLRPLVVKGLVCRRLYPLPDSRFSGDEDVFSGEQQFKACQKTMIAAGLEPCGDGPDSYEIPFRREGSPLYIELHKTLFPQDSDIFGDCNRLFDRAFDRAVEISVEGVPVATLCPTDHMLYLILHAFKHFLHSGFGIRQVCDMILFANEYGPQVDWDYVRKKCRSIRADKFAEAILAIGEKHLTFSPERAACPWRLEADPEPMLADLLRGGIYGSADRNRLHSSNMTLNAVAADKKGRRSDGDLLKTVFPPAKSIENRFPYLRRAPFLLPVAWTARLFGFARESLARRDSAAAQIIRTGSMRIELLRQYDIID